MPPRFTTDDVRHLATLARLDLTADELTTFAAQLSGILTFVADVQAVDTSAVVLPDDQPAAPPLREDTPQPSLRRDEVLGEAPAAETTAGLFTVPRVPGQ